MKVILTLLFLLGLISFTEAQLSASVTVSKADDPNGGSKPENKPFIRKGWLKFFTYVPDFKSVDAPTKFEYNQQYYDQFTFGRNASFDPSKDKDQWGWYDIPSDTHFYFVLTARSLYAISARRNDMAKTVKSLELEWIENALIDNAKPNQFKGGIEDIGNFREGFCFRLKLRNKAIWNLCADTMVEKEYWMKEIFRLIIKEDITGRGSGGSLVISPEVLVPIKLADDPQPPLPEKGQPLIPRNGAKVDGRWAILQDWSSCTLACGGGKQYLQRMCVPPMNGGAPCQGKPIMERDCNMQPCPNIISHRTEGSLPTVVRMQRISQRPQRYEICVIKEGDLELMLKMPQLPRSPRFPVRVVLNNKTISVFTTPSYDSVYMSFDLNKLVMKLNKEDPSACFELSDTRDEKKYASLCIMPTSMKPGDSLEQTRDAWMKDISFFKEKCFDKSKFVNLVDPNLEQQKKEIAIEEQNAKFQRIEESNEEEKEKKIETKLSDSAKIAMEAVEKEMRFEQLALKEEMMREKDDERSIAQSIEKEKSKQRCLERELKKKEKLQELDKQTATLSTRIDEIEQAAILQVKAARARTAEKIAAMKRASDRKRREGQRQIQEIRTSMASEIMKENYIGNETLCYPTRSLPDRKEYCKKNFADEPDKSRDCVTSALDFCYVCCENEFGRMHTKLRQKCYEICDKSKNEQTDGFWTWVPRTNAVDAKAS